VNFTKDARQRRHQKGDSIRESFNTRKWFWYYFANAATCATCDSSSFAKRKKKLFEKVFLGSYVTKGMEFEQISVTHLTAIPGFHSKFLSLRLKMAMTQLLRKLLSSKDKSSLIRAI